MKFLLDTNVVSEWTKVRPNAAVTTWLTEVDEDRVFLSVVTIAELRRGVERLPAGERRKRLDEWMQGELPLRFEGRVIPVSELIANEWGRVVARREIQGRPIHAMDALIAATAEVHSLTLVTRNEADFRLTVKSVVNPWTG
jgi:predicted nucleic acid-binding protein